MTQNGSGVAFKTSRLLLRPFELTDADDVYAYARDPEWGRFQADTSQATARMGYASPVNTGARDLPRRLQERSSGGRSGISASQRSPRSRT